MNITKRKNKEPRHYELKMRTTVQDAKDFSSYILENRLHKSKKALRVLLQICTAIILISINIVILLFLDHIGWNSIEKAVALCCLTAITTNIILKFEVKFPKISDSDAQEAVMRGIAPWGGEAEREVLFSLGEKGFSTNAGMLPDTKVYEYGVFNRVVECELGIIMILDDVDIYCIPARYFNDETACFITEKLRKKCRGRYKTKGLMKINRNLQ